MSGTGDPVAEEVAVLVHDLGDIVVEPDPDTTGVSRYRRGPVAFARTAPGRLEVRLPADIADAALRTSETSVLPGARGWVRFSPSGDRRDVRDRAAAWFRTAWRHAAR
jgi:hypothetical protein